MKGLSFVEELTFTDIVHLGYWEQDERFY